VDFWRDTVERCPQRVWHVRADGVYGNVGVDSDSVWIAGVGRNARGELSPSDRHGQCKRRACAAADVHNMELSLGVGFATDERNGGYHA